MPFGDRDDDLWGALKPSFKPRLVSDPKIRYARHLVNGTGPFAPRSSASARSSLRGSAKATLARVVRRTPEVLVKVTGRKKGAKHLAAQLMAESAAPAPGKGTTIAFAMKPEKGWHGYWENPGDAGLGMTVTWTLPKGVTIGALRYPVPETLLISGLMNHVYEGPYAVLANLSVAPDVAAGTRLPIRVKAEWLA